jgi:hypothetical protein
MAAFSTQAQTVLITTNEVLGLTAPDRTLFGSTGAWRWTINARSGGEAINFDGDYSFVLDVFADADGYRLLSVTNDPNPRLSPTNGQVRYSFQIAEPGSFVAQAMLIPNVLTNEAYFIGYVNLVVTNPPVAGSGASSVSVTITNITEGGVAGAITNNQHNVTLGGTFIGDGSGLTGVSGISAFGIYSAGAYIGQATGVDYNAQFGVTITNGIARIAGVPAGTLPNYPVSIFTNEAPYTYTGSDQYFVVPGNVTSVLVKAWGGAGGGSGNIAGGNGGYAQAIIPVVPLETLVIRVGGGGVCGTIQPSGPTCTNNVFGGGGYHSITNNMYGFQRASGGGATWVFRVASGETVPYPLTTNDLTNVTVLVVAGGGGGASSHGNAGLGGGLAGGNSLNGGFGGTQDAGGVPATVGSNSVAGTFAFAQQLAAHLDISCLGFTFANNFAFEEDWSTGIGVGLLSGQSGPGKAVVRY